MSKGEATCYILGSGSSLNELTTEEREYLHNHPRTLAFNKYLLFWNVLGVIPTDFLLVDRHFPAHIVFARTIETSRKLNKTINLYLERVYAKYCQTDWWSLADGLRHRFILKWKYSFWMPLKIIGTKARYCHNILNCNLPFRWASSLDEPLFFYRGSLVSAINLATIIYPGCNIKLLGVDLYSNEYFFDDHLREYPELIDKFYFLGDKAGRHPTALDIGSTPSILTIFPKVFKHLENSGIDIACCNPKSLLVTEGMCSYSPVQEDW